MAEPDLSGNVAHLHAWYFNVVYFLHNSKARSMFWCGRYIFEGDVWGSSGKVALWHTWCFCMDFKGTFDVLAWSIYVWGWSLRSLMECLLPARLVFQNGNCFERVANLLLLSLYIYLRLIFKVFQGMFLVGKLDFSGMSMLWYSQLLIVFKIANEKVTQSKGKSYQKSFCLVLTHKIQFAGHDESWQLTKQTNRLINSHWKIRFMIAMFVMKIAVYW